MLVVFDGPQDDIAEQALLARKRQHTAVFNAAESAGCRRP